MSAQADWARKRQRPPTWRMFRQDDGTAVIVNSFTGRVEGRISYDFPGMDALRIPVTPPGAQ